MTVCRAEECENEAGKSKGLCGKHYHYWQRYGTLERKYPLHLLVRSDEGCLLDTGSVDRNGYAYAQMGGKSTRAHIKAYVEAYGPVPDGMLVGHVCHDEARARGECGLGRCDHRRCVEPEHLKAMTNKENLQVLRRNDFKCGHPYTEENTYYRKDGKKTCRICDLARVNAANARKRAER